MKHTQMKNIYVITGGTMVHVTPHFSLCAPAYGHVGSEIIGRLSSKLDAKNKQTEFEVFLVRTKMAGGNSERTLHHLAQLNFHLAIETNDDLEAFIKRLVARTETGGIIMCAAICDFMPTELSGMVDEHPVLLTEFGKDKKRLHHAHDLTLQLQPSRKIIDLIKTTRPDIFLVTFKTTAGATKETLVAQALHNLQRSKSDLVFANDIHHHENYIVAPDGTLFTGEDRATTLDIFCDEFMRRIL